MANLSRAYTMSATNHDGHSNDGHKPWRPQTMTMTATAMRPFWWIKTISKWTHLFHIIIHQVISYISKLQCNSSKIHTPATKSIVMFCGHHGYGLWPSWFVAILVMVCGRHGLWPSLMWPSWSFLWPSWFVAVIVEPLWVRLHSHSYEYGL